MADLKPPRAVWGERETLTRLLQYHRESVVRKVDGVDEDAARTSPVASGTSLLWVVGHLADAEDLWFGIRFAGTAPPADIAQLPASMADAVARYRAAWARSDATIAAHDLEDLCHDTGDEHPTNLRWVLAHLLEETARHAGHVDILREMIDGAAGR